MTPIAWTEITVWPIESIHAMPRELLIELADAELVPRTVREALRDDLHSMTSRIALWHPGPTGEGLLRVTDESAVTGIEAYRPLLLAAEACGLSYHAHNEDGDHFPGRIEHHIDGRTARRRLHKGDIFVTAADLGGTEAIEALSDGVLAARVREVLLAVLVPPVEPSR